MDGSIFFFSLMINRTIFSGVDSRYRRLQPGNDSLISLCVLNAGVLQKGICSFPGLLSSCASVLWSFLGKKHLFLDVRFVGKATQFPH